jgi:small subunit ribosomal protein S2e
MSGEAASEQPRQEQGRDDFGGGFGRGRRGGRFGDRERRGRGRFGDREDRGRRRRRGGRDGDKKDWVPVTKLGRLVQAGKIRSLEEIYLFSLSIKESEIIDYFLKDTLKDEVMKIMPVQKQTAAGQRTKFKAFVVVGDYNGHLGLGQKCSREVSGAIKGAISDAKLSVIPVRRGYWGNRLGAPHTVPCKITGKCGSVRFRLIPAPRGAGIVAAKCCKKVLAYAGFKDLYTNSHGNTKTLGNFIKATYNAVKATNAYLTPDLWPQTVFEKAPFQVHTDFLKEGAKKSVGKAIRA